MKKMRTVTKVAAGALAAAALLVGAVAMPAQAQDTGWNKSTHTKVDTGWN